MTLGTNKKQKKMFMLTHETICFCEIEIILGCRNNLGSHFEKL